jgi:hypothetical protein
MFLSKVILKYFNYTIYNVNLGKRQGNNLSICNISLFIAVIVKLNLPPPTTFDAGNLDAIITGVDFTSNYYKK